MSNLPLHRVVWLGLGLAWVASLSTTGCLDAGDGRRRGGDGGGGGFAGGSTGTGGFAGGTTGGGGISNGSGGATAADGGFPLTGQALRGQTDPCATITWPTAKRLCGSSLSPTAQASRLYLCQDHKTVRSMLCADGCQRATGAGSDFCKGTDPCVSAFVDGDTCGDDLGPLADPGTLYECEGQRVMDINVCAHGCSTNGVSGVCKP